MGHIAHDAVLVTTWASKEDYMPDVEAFRASMPEQFQPLLVGPIPSVTNGYVTYLFAPDGSKDGWETSEEAAQWRERFINLWKSPWEDGTPFEIVAIRYGSDEAIDGRPAEVVYQQPSTLNKKVK